MNTLVRTVHDFSTDVGMEFGAKKCGILTLKNKSEGIRLPNCEVMKEVEKKELKWKKIKEYKQRLPLVLKSKLNGRNKMQAIRAWAVSVFRYGAGILKWKDI